MYVKLVFEQNEHLGGCSTLYDKHWSVVICLSQKSCTKLKIRSIGHAFAHTERNIPSLCSPVPALCVSDVVKMFWVDPTHPFGYLQEAI